MMHPNSQQDSICTWINSGKPSGTAKNTARAGKFTLQQSEVQKGEGSLEDQIGLIVKSTHFKIYADRSTFSINGPDHYYYASDDGLAKWASQLRWTGDAPEIGQLRICTGSLSFCLDDCWSGYFLAALLSQQEKDTPLVMLHADDHKDMMPTLLVRDAGGVLQDVASGRLMNPENPDDWLPAIRSGAVGIGNFITPFAHSGREVHIRHLDNSLADTGLRGLAPGVRQYGIIPEYQFAAADLVSAETGVASTYRAAPDPAHLLDDAPHGLFVVHLDFDYLVNDFNGNARQTQLSHDLDRETMANAKLSALFAVIAANRRRVDQWILATSPGFCASHRWKRLLAQILEGISKIDGPSAPDRLWLELFGLPRDKHEQDQSLGSKK